MLRQDDWQKAKLVTVMWQHGNAFGGHLASCMIGSVIASRVKRGWGNWSEVIDRIPRFAAIKEMPTGTPEIWDASFVKLLHEVDSIYDGSKNYAQSKSSDGSMRDALYWADLSKIDNPWFTEHITGRLDIHPRIMDMNTLAFFA